MEIEQLKNFLAVAEAENFTHAAKKVGLSQPALSRSVARLEEELGQPVFERQTRCVMLTDAGRLLAKRAREILALIEDTLAEITDDGQSGWVRVGAIPTVAPFFLPELLRQFASEFPQSHVAVQEETTDVLLKQCAHGEIDVAVLALPINARYLQSEELLEEELLLVLPQNHRLKNRRRITLADIEDYPFVLLGEAHCLSDHITSFCRRRSFQPVSVERTSQLVTVQELVSLEHGVSMIPAMARKLDDSKRRIYKSIAGPKPTRRIAMVWNPYRYQSQLLGHFQQALQQYAGQFAELKRS